MCADAGIIDTLPIDVPGDADTAAPMVLGTTPSDGATGVARDTTIKVVFDEPVINVDTTSFTVADASAVSGTITPSSPTTYEFTPNSAMQPNATISVTLTSAITDGSGNPLAPYPFSFQTTN